MKSVEVRLVGRFRFTGKIHGHHQHLLYYATHTQNQSIYILKGQQAKNKSPVHYQSILHEGKILQMMQGGLGIPHMQWCGQEEDYNFIVLEELQRSIELYHTKCNNKFTFKTVLMLGVEIISILQYFHFKNFIHNHLSPHHLLMGHGNKYGKLFLIDYSNATRYRDNQTLEHIESNINVKCEKRNFNMLFSSINCHKGHSTSRKDDLISLLYMMIYLLNGELPWSSILQSKKTVQQKSKQILDIKQNTNSSKIFEGYPDLEMLYKYTEKLTFDQKPRYTYYRNVFRQRMERQGYLQDGIYDWMLISEDFENNLDDFELNFEIVPNEEQFIKNLAQQMKMKEKAQTEILQKKKTENNIVKGNSKSDKQCIIY